MAILGLREFKGVLPEKKLHEILKKSKPLRVKQAVLISFADEKGGAPVSVLARIWKEETDPDMKRMLVMILGQTKSDEAVPILLEAARDKDTRTATAAVMALGQIGTPKAEAARREIIDAE